MDFVANLTVARLAQAKGLDRAFLESAFGLRDRTYAGVPAVAIPYRDASGAIVFHKIRLADGSARRDPPGGPYSLYGVDRLGHAHGPRGR